MAERQLAGMTRPAWRHIAGRLCRAAVVMLPVTVGYFLLCPLLLVVARTWPGRLFGAMWLAFSVYAGLLFGGAKYSSDGLIAVAIAVGSALLFGGLMGFTRPRARPRPESGLWSDGPNVPQPQQGTWWRRGMLTFETDYARLAVALITRLDPWMSRAEARTVRRVMKSFLAEMDADPAYLDLYPGYAENLRGTILGRYWLGHCYAYIPPGVPEWQRLGVLVFLHGHGPNSAVYLHAWRRFADEYGFAVIAPTFGYGNWEHPDGIEAVRWVLDNALHPDRCDPARVYLAGISQGGAGVARAGAALADRLAGLVFLSPTLEPGVLDTHDFVAGWKGRPVFVAQGGKDHNVRPDGVAAGVGLMKRNGAEVTYHFDPDADHFLFFANREGLFHRIGGWVGGQPTS